jgi:hypothetical protein
VVRPVSALAGGAVGCAAASASFALVLLAAVVAFAGWLRADLSLGCEAPTLGADAHDRVHTTMTRGPSSSRSRGASCWPNPARRCRSRLSSSRPLSLRSRPDVGGAGEHAGVVLAVSEPDAAGPAAARRDGRVHALPFAERAERLLCGRVLVRPGAAEETGEHG